MSMDTIIVRVQKGVLTIGDVDPVDGSGSGLPDGGTTGQVLTKKSTANGDADWEDATGGVVTVNGHAGVVVLGAADVGAATPSDVSAEATARANADSTNAAAITTEATARANADTNLIPLAQKAAASGVATLDSNALIPVNQLPSLSITDTTPVGSQAAMLALPAQKGDIAIRTDLNETFILAASDPTILGNWLQLPVPVGGVSSVNTRSGAVTGLAEASTTVSAGAGLSGGGDLSANRTIGMPNVGTAGTTGDATHVVQVTTDAQGRITGATAVAITGLAQSDIVGLVAALAAKAPTASPTFTGTVTIPTGAALGTPASATLTNATGLPISTGVSGLAAGIAALLATPSSANLRAALTDETGTGAAVFANAPALVAPTGIVKADVGLGNVDNVADASKSFSGSQITSGTVAIARIASGTPNGSKFVRDDGTLATPSSSGISDPGGSNDDVLQRKAGAWANRTLAQYAADLEAAAFDARYAAIAAVGFQGLNAATVAARAAADAGYFICTPGTSDAFANLTPLYAPSGTAGKLDRIAGTVVLRGVQLPVAAVTAISTTITSLADATKDRWCWVEIDSTGTTQFNNGTAVLAPALPSVPTITAGRTPAALLYIPAAATAVDALVTTANGNAKLYTAVDGVAVIKQPSDGWQFDNNGKWVYGTQNGDIIQYAVTGDARSYLPVGTKVSWNDGSVKYGVVQGVSLPLATPITGVTSDVSANTFGKTAHGMANGTPILLSLFTLTTGISVNTIYFVVGTAANTFQIAATVSGSAIDLTGSNDGAFITVTGASLVSLVAQTDYTVTNAAFVNCRYSYHAQPPGFPTAFNWLPTIVGWSGSPPTSSVYRWSSVGRMMTLFVRQSTATTSTGTLHTLTLPVAAAATIANHRWETASYGGTDNTAAKPCGDFDIASAGTVLTMNNLADLSGVAGAGNTNGGTSRHMGQITFEF